MVVEVRCDIAREEGSRDSSGCLLASFSSRYSLRLSLSGSSAWPLTTWVAFHSSSRPATRLGGLPVISQSLFRDVDPNAPPGPISGKFSEMAKRFG